MAARKVTKTPSLVKVDGTPLKQVASFSPAFSGASYGRAGRNWMASGAGPSFVTMGSLSTLRNRARDLGRNDPWIARQAKIYASNLVGKGIRPVAKSPDKGWNRACMEIWNDWVYECDVAGKLTFYAMQAMAARCIYFTGEGLLRDVYGADENSVLPYQLQFLEGDYLDHNYNTRLENGNRIIQGVEMGRYKAEAYHLFKDHPAEMLWGQNNLERIRVPASDIQHFCVQDRPGQIRGVPVIVSVLLKIMDFLEYEEAELTRKKYAAMFVAFVQTLSDDPDAFKALLASDENDEGDDEATIEPGTVQHLRPGESITFNPPADVGGSYEPFTRNQHRALAAGGDTTYEQRTGDLTGVNFTSARVGLNEIRRMYEQIQEFVLKPQICLPVWKKVIHNAVLSGQLTPPKEFYENSRPFLRVNFVSPGWPFVNPQQEEMAAQMAIRGGTESRENVNAQKGYDVTEIDLQQAADYERSDELGLMYDTDGRRVSKSGNPNPDPKFDSDQ